MNTKQKAESGKQECQRLDVGSLMPGGRMLVAGQGLAVALGVSLRTVERMVRDEEIKPVRLRRAVRFHAPMVLDELIANALTRKHGRKADVEKLKAEMLKAEIGTGQEGTRYPRRAE